MPNNEHETRWKQVKDKMLIENICLGPKFSHLFKNYPDKILSYISLYKFAAKMIGKNKRVLDIGCMEGFGTWLLAFECGIAKGIDSDEYSIKTAVQNFNENPLKQGFKNKKVSYEVVEPLSLFNENPLKQGLKTDNNWDAVVFFNTIISIENPLKQGLKHLNEIDAFMIMVSKFLTVDGITIIGIHKNTFDINHKAGFSLENFKQTMRKYFEHTFFFSAIGENILVRLDENSQYIIALGCKKRLNQ